MMVTIDHGELRQDVFRFWIDGHAMSVVLSSYERLERESRRHKFKVVAKYPKGGEYGATRIIPEEQVPLTPAVLAAARDKLLDELKFPAPIMPDTEEPRP